MELPKCRGHRYGDNTLTFYAQDLTTNSPVVVATVPCNTNKFTNAAVGTNEDAAALTNGPVVHRLVTDNALSPVDYFDATEPDPGPALLRDGDAERRHFEVV